MLRKGSGDAMHRQESLFYNCKPAIVHSRKIGLKIHGRLNLTSGLARVFADRGVAKAPAFAFAV